AACGEASIAATPLFRRRRLVVGRTIDGADDYEWIKPEMATRHKAPQHRLQCNRIDCNHRCGLAEQPRHIAILTRWAATRPGPFARQHGWHAHLHRRCSKGPAVRIRWCVFSISPEILKPIRRERRVANRRSNRPMAKIVLDRSSVPPIVGQLVA